MYLWMLIFFSQPHKEERFLYPVYPLICLCGAVGLSALQVWLAAVRSGRERSQDLCPRPMTGGAQVTPPQGFWGASCGNCGSGKPAASHWKMLSQLRLPACLPAKQLVWRLLPPHLTVCTFCWVFPESRLE